MNRTLITTLAFCLLIISAGKGYANIDMPLFNGVSDVMSTHVSDMKMAESCDHMDSSGGGVFSHFHCHLNITSLVTQDASIGLMELPVPNYQYHFSSKVHIPTLSTKPPQFT
ncbi:MAG: hypothetical protein HOH40_10205 [Oceanospirillaceae bacterium]|jgi:hypothetical protein|nr:hypothetical protein [Oceanospirillaceae bacterium]MBT5629331.1 hypothetical protein [Oceanospirillaceae bacterium]MBT6101851.1 hypothetical protein [Oceanospirillaceae bacterium]MBT7674902.1 hypothetical protein [Oceanospirillaceae bacterium]MDC0085532.1 hypothetical protein [Oceanospirillaceae bacterium]